MSPLNYYMVRHSTQSLYTFEATVVLAVWIVVLVLWRRAGDRRALAVYVVGGLYDSAIEMLAATSGTRTITAVQLFGVIPVGFPLLPLILGFFEGGVLLLVGFELVRGILERDRAALAVGLGVMGALWALIAVGAAVMHAQLAANASDLTLTVRPLLTPGSLVILAGCYSVALAYVFGVRRGDRRERQGLFLWYACIAITAAAWYTPVFVSGGRRIAALVDGSYLPVSMGEQLAVLYGFSLLFEAAGFYLPVYVILRALGLIRETAAPELRISPMST